MFNPAVRAVAALQVTGPDGRGGAMISGDPHHPANFGRLCSKGYALAETLSLDTRLLHPMLRLPDGSLVRVRLAPEREISPAPEEGKRVVFRSHCLRGFGLPLSGFLCSFLEFYKL